MTDENGLKEKDGCKPYAPVHCYDGTRPAKDGEYPCDKCSAQEGRHYCLLQGTSVENMGIVTCDYFQMRKS